MNGFTTQGPGAPRVDQGKVRRATQGRAGASSSGDESASEPQVSLVDARDVKIATTNGIGMSGFG